MTDTKKKIKTAILALLKSYSAIQIEVIIGHLEQMHGNTPSIAETSSTINEMVSEEIIQFNPVDKNYFLVKNDDGVYSAPIWLLDYCKCSAAFKEYIIVEDPELDINLVKGMIEDQDVTALTKFISSVTFSDNLSRFPKGMNVDVGRIIHGVNSGDMIGFSIIVKEQQAPLEL